MLKTLSVLPICTLHVLNKTSVTCLLSESVGCLLLRRVLLIFYLQCSTYHVGNTYWPVLLSSSHICLVIFVGKLSQYIIIVRFVFIIKLYYRIAVHIRRHISQLSKTQYNKNTTIKNTTLQK